MKGKTNNKKKKALALLGALAVLAALASTFAWTTYQEWVKNHLQSRGTEEGRVVIVEKFDNSGKITPTIKKEVDILNSSDTPAFVRVTFEEALQRLENDAKLGYTGVTALGTIGESVKTDNQVPFYANIEPFLRDGSGWEQVTGKLAFMPSTDPTDSSYKAILDAAAPISAEIGSITGTAGSVTEVKEGWVLFKKANEYALTYIVKRDKNHYPSQYDYNKASDKLPAIMTSGDDMYLAVKVSGFGTLNASGNVVFQYAANSTATEREVSFGTYNAKLGAEVMSGFHGGSSNIATSFTDAQTGLPVSKGTLTFADTSIPAANQYSISKVDRLLLNPANTNPTAAFDATGNLVDRDQIKQITFGMPNVTTDINEWATKGSVKPWFYNEEDGYFYYNDVILSGVQSSLPVMSTVEMPAAKVDGKEELTAPYKLSSYDIHVGMQAIPAYLAAIKSGTPGNSDFDAEDGSWSLDITKGNAKLIYEHLAQFAVPDDKN